jgi:hypothetical protein
MLNGSGLAGVRLTSFRPRLRTNAEAREPLASSRLRPGLDSRGITESHRLGGLGGSLVRAERRLFAALRAQALAPRRAQIRRIWRVGACDHLCTATVVMLVFLTGIDGAGDRSRRPDHPRRLVAAVPVGLGSPPQVSGGVIPGGLSQLLGSGCPSGLPPAARNRAPPPPGAKSPRDHAGQPRGNRPRLAGCS